MSEDLDISITCVNKFYFLKKKKLMSEFYWNQMNLNSHTNFSQLLSIMNEILKLPWCNTAFNMITDSMSTPSHLHTYTQWTP